jgi:hypothetical protein
LDPTRRKQRPLPHRGWALLTAALWVCPAAAQTTRLAVSQPASELPSDVQVALDGIEDFSFSFAQPGFYAVIEHLKTTSSSPGHVRLPLEVDDWGVLLERPADFRGLPVTIEGVVGRNKPWRFEQEEYRRLGTVWQLELWRADQPITATLILTNDASDIPLEATIRVTGYFVMIRQYYSRTNRIRQAALLLADGPTVVSRAIARTSTPSRLNLFIGLVVALTAALLVIWIVLRRSVARTRHATPALRASSHAPVSLADDLATWAAEEPDQTRAQPDDANASGVAGKVENANNGDAVDRP